MTQQINLYTPEEEVRRGPVLFTLLAVVAAAALLLAYRQYLQGENAQLEKRVAQVKTELASQRSTLKTMKDSLAQRTDPARLAAELAAVKAGASAAQEFLLQLERGDLGSLEGYGTHLVTLARVGEPGVWLTSLKVTTAGKRVEVDGRSLQAESVLRYAGELNRHFATHGASLTAVEMTPVVSADQSASAIAFKLR
jgi:Tfp pilus assembly protein PilN